MTRPPRPPGMDHALYPYAPIHRRPSLPWPDAAQIAWFVVLHLEYWEAEPPAGSLRDPRFVGEYGSFQPDLRSFTQREYGNRVGIWRVLEVLDRHGIRTTLAANGEACGRYPEIVRAALDRGMEFVAHGTYATRMISSRMDEAEERDHIHQAIAAVEAAAGRRPQGWLGQDYGESERTPVLLAEAGIDYLMDWPNDDQPYLMPVCGRGLVTIPNQYEWDDLQLFLHRRIPTPRYPDLVGEAFEVLQGEGGRVFGLTIHPWMFGMAHRIRYLDEALRRLKANGETWQATAGEIAAWYRRTAEPSRA